MAFQLKKSFSFIATLIIVLIIAFVGYFFINLNKGPYAAADFLAIQYSWGVGDTLANTYNSSTGDYQYLDQKDQIVKKNVKLRANNIIFLHSKANALNFWQLPDTIANKEADLKSSKILRYEMVFTYDQKVKKIIFLTNYDENPTIAEAAAQLQKIIAQTIDEAEERYTN